MEAFPHVEQVWGFDINPQYVLHARRVWGANTSQAHVRVRRSDFFTTDWAEVLNSLVQPILVTGNPPWVTNADLSVYDSHNLPPKRNRDGLRGIDALTGRSNFDISEWMIRHLLELLSGEDGLLAMICKTSVARRVLLHAWQNHFPVRAVSIYKLDARKHFSVSVDACLLIAEVAPRGPITTECQVFPSLDARQASVTWGFLNGRLIADTQTFSQWRHLLNVGSAAWRSGVKHDCSKVFELQKRGNAFLNGLGEVTELEAETVFPLLKGSALSALGALQRRAMRGGNRVGELERLFADEGRWILIPQRSMQDDPRRLALEAPRTWNYLVSHVHLLDARKSSVYRKRPQFSIFGIGSYSFAPWKLAISGLHKQFNFVKVPPLHCKPVMLDDTCYFFPCPSQEACELLHELVVSEPAQAFWSALVLWDAKRPITAALLNSLDLLKLARTLGKEQDFKRVFPATFFADSPQEANQISLF